MIVIYKTQEYLNNIDSDPSQKGFIEKKLEELGSRQQMEDGKNPRCYDRANGIWVYKFMGKGQNSRLILQDLKVEENQIHQIIIVRDYISQDKYEPKWRVRFEPMVDRGEYLLNFPLPVEDEENAQQLYQTFVNQPKKEKPQIPADSSNWLATFTIDYTFNVYESNNWPKYQKKLADYRAELFRSIKHVVDHENSGAVRFDQSTGRELYHLEHEEIHLIYEKMENPNSTDHLLLLHGWCPKGTMSDLQSLKEESISYEPFEQVGLDGYNLSLFSRGAYRGYPFDVFQREDGREAWFNIQLNSNKSNLALSSEQVELLRNVKFPIFINGQAGSGKSEMLMYLFCEMMFYKEAEEFKGDLIFLTENEELLERSHVEVIEKLRFNHRYKDYPISPDQIKSKFHTYQEFLRNQFFDKEDEIFERISKDDRYIQFYRFKKLYEGSMLPQKILKQFPAEIAWFVINTFIRGFDISTDECTPSKFKEIPRRTRSFISDEIFREIYDTIWIGFYKGLLEKEGYWDRIMVIREIFNKYGTIPENKKYTVIVCDEAQDFTRLELQFLLQLSVFSEYNLSNLYPPQVPVTFAGDPFQTVNPTGFNLAQLKGLFASELENTFEIDVNQNGHLFVKDLYSNYRSVPEVVNLANAIQYLRHKYLQLNELNSPQLARRLSSGSHPKLIRLDRNDDQQIYNKLKFHVFIPPCNNSEESEYRGRDQFLKQFPDIGIKSAARSKGNEYPKVVLYKFGEYFIQEFGKDLLKELLDGQLNLEELEQGKRFQISFLFNKLYVAITRAMEDLNILDTKEGHQFFWDLMRRHPNLAILQGNRLEYANIDQPSWELVNINTIFDEAGVDILGEADFQTAYRNAMTEMEQGNLHGDSEKMRDAVLWFKKINQDDDYQNLILYCEGRAAQFDHEYKRAGDLFNQCKIGNLPDEADPLKLASDNYWMGGHWNELIDLHGDRSVGTYLLRNIVARLMLNRGFDFQDLIRNSENIHKALTGDKRFLGRINWLAGFYNQLITQIDDRIDSLAGSWGMLATSLSVFDDLPEDLRKRIARLYFKDRNFKQAFEIWQEIGDVEHKDFWEAGIQVTENANTQIYYLDRLGRKQEIITQYIDSINSLDLYTQSLVLETIYRDGSIHEAAILGVKHPKIRPIIENIARNDKIFKRAQLFFEEYIEGFISSHEPESEAQYIKDVIKLGLDLFKAHQLKDYNALTAKIDRKDEQSAIGIKISKIINRKDDVRRYANYLLRASAWSDLKPENNIDDLDSIISNYLTFLSREFIDQLDVFEVSAALDKVVSKYSQRQNLYVMTPGLLLRNDDLDIHQRKVIEYRFWNIRYRINLRESVKEEDIQRGLKETYKRFGDYVSFQEHPDFGDLKRFENLPEIVFPSDLQAMSSEEERVFKEAKDKKEGARKHLESSSDYEQKEKSTSDSSNTVKSKSNSASLQKKFEEQNLQANVPNDFHNIILKLNSTIERLESKLDESNQQLLLNRSENDALRKKNEELMEKIISLLDR